MKDVNVNLEFKNNVAVISVEDDSKEGFKDLRDSYTLYKETDKRKDAEKRGRFNLGEKQAFSICEKAIVSTTKGTIVFDKKGRSESSSRKSIGSEIRVWVKMNEEEFKEILEVIDMYIVPENISFFVNGKRKQYLKPYKVFETNITTEISDGEVMRRTRRTTKIEVLKTKESYLYEMGIPVTKIDCEFSINVKQKIPLSADRETVSQSYLRDIFAEVLNNIYEDVDEESSSQIWIREAMSDDRVNKEAVETIIEKRYGDKVVVADPFDLNSIDEAISHGFRVIRGNELSKDEWNNIRRFDALESSSGMFGTSLVEALRVEPNDEQIVVANFAKKLAKRLLNITIDVTFVKEREMVAAQFGSNELTFNIAKLGKNFFKDKLQTISLILHEIAHHEGNHTDHSYHDALTSMAQDLVNIALREPEFFD